MEKTNILKFIGLAGIITLVLGVLKLTHCVTCTWWAVLLPVFVALGFLMIGYGVLILLVALGKGK